MLKISKDKIIYLALHAMLRGMVVVGVAMMFSEPAEADGIIKHNGFPEDSIVQSYVQHAYEISNGDMDFITTLEAENGLWNPHRQSEVWSKGVREDSWGFCQLHRAWHSAIVDDPRFKTDPYRQLDQCWKKYSGGTRFYGYDVRHRVRNRFSFDGTYAQQVKNITYEQSTPSTVNTYMEAKKIQNKLDKAREETKRALAEEKRLELPAKKAWKECKTAGDCVE